MTSTMPVYPDLAGKVAAVTGGSRGIGAATCRMLAANSAKVMVNDRDETAVGIPSRASVRAAATRPGSRATPQTSTRCNGSARRPNACTGRSTCSGRSSAAAVHPRADRPDHGAGMGRGHPRQPQCRVPDPEAFLPGMVERRRGSIITMASTAGRYAGGDPIGAPTGYAVAKAGLVRLTQEVAKEVARNGVRVNCVSPSTVLTNEHKR